MAQPGPSSHVPPNQRIRKGERVNSTNSNDDPSTNSLLKQLKQLQIGTIKAHQVTKAAPKVTNRDHQQVVQTQQLKSMMRQHQSQQHQLAAARPNASYIDEVNRINRSIQQMIQTEVKPQLTDIVNSMSTQSNFTVYELYQEHRDDSLEVPVTKTKIDDDREIYRYTIPQLCKLIPRANADYLPRLCELDIFSGGISSDDRLLVKLLKAENDEQRMQIILTAAAGKKLIKRVGTDEFKFTIPCDSIKSMGEKYKMKKKPTCQQSQGVVREPEHLEGLQIARMRKESNFAAEIEEIKKSAPNDEKMNERIYKLEFCELFKESLKLNEPIMGRSFNEMVQYLIDTKAAFIVEGEIRINARNNSEAYITHPTGMRDPCVNKIILMKESMHGDIVRVLVKNAPSSPPAETSSDMHLELNNSADLGVEPESRLYGCVLEILQKKHCRRIIGTFANVANLKSLKKKLSFLPRDTRVPKIHIKTESVKSLNISEDQLMIAEIIGWKNETPKARILQVIGEKGKLKTENTAILLQNNLNPEPFSQEILDSLPGDDFVIPPEEFTYRADLRKKCIFSIDPETARDLDDAISCEVLPNGNYEVGVHISDVSYFLKEGSKLDEIVKEKATTIYLVDQVYHMLPVPLCLLCSLLPGADKVAYSVFWEMKPATAEIVNTRFTRSVLNSCAKLSYEHAQMVIDGKHIEDGEFPEIFNGFTAADISDVIKKLQGIAELLRTGRKENGSLKIDQPKISFRFDREDARMEAPVDFFQYITGESNWLIEEFALLANGSVAKMIQEKFPKISLLRRHDPPNPTALKKLVKNLEKHGVTIDFTTSKSAAETMEAAILGAKTNREGFNACVNLLVSKTMTRARYFCSDMAVNEKDFEHYALSIPIYTHFTSPIRRYADILVHRVLNAALDYEPEPERSPEEVQKLAEVCNAQKYSAKIAGEDSSNLYFMHFIESQKCRTMKVGIVGVYEYNFEVVLIETGHVVKIYYKVI